MSTMLTHSGAHDDATTTALDTLSLNVIYLPFRQVLVFSVSADQSPAPKSGSPQRTTRLKWRLSFQRRADTLM
jgi:hypothetical protein